MTRATDLRCLLVSLATVAASAAACRGREAPAARSDTVATALPATASASTQADRTIAAPYGVFAYADTSGTRLLAAEAPSPPQSLIQAVCQSATRAPVRFAHYQEASKASSHRQRAKNFSNEAGFVYHVAGDDVVEPDETCFLATDSLLRLGRMIIGARSAPGSSCVQADSARIAVAKSRALISCTLLLSSDSLSHVAAVQFENRGDSALASIALVDTSKVAFLDYPAIAPPGESTWRVDDGGRFYPEHFRVLFVIGAPALQLLAFTWGAPEGVLLTLAASAGSSDSLVEVMRSYHYW